MKNLSFLFFGAVFGSGKFHQDTQRGGYGGGYGDPHFMVHTAGQEPICFDYSPIGVSEITLLMDPVRNRVEN